MVVRVWETDMKRKMDECVRAIVTILESRHAHSAAKTSTVLAAGR
jgi:hypothetical protein